MFILFGFVSCNKSTTPREFFDIPEFALINGSTFDQEIIMQPPSQIEIIDNNLFFFRPMGVVAKGVNKSNGIPTMDLPRIGNAPGEFISPYFAGENKDDSTFYVSDASYRLIRKYKWDVNHNAFSYKLLEEKKWNDLKTSFYVVNRMKNGYFVVLSNSGKTKLPLALLDSDLNMVSEFGEMFEEGEKINPHLYHGAFASFEKQIVYAAIDFGYLVSYLSFASSTCLF